MTSSEPEATREPANPLVVIAAPNGARLGKSDHSEVPLSTDEIADCALRLAQCGVAVLHLHVRDDDGAHTLDAGRYREAMAAIRERVADQLIVQVTTEAVGRYSPREQMAVVRALGPEAVSLALQELCPDQAAEPEAGEFFRETTGRGVWPQYILYSPDECRRFDRLRREGFFGVDRPFALFVLGRYATGREGRPGELDGFLETFEPRAFPWAVCCFGPQESIALRRAAEAGGHVRIGFENNQSLPDGTVARDNAELVRATLEKIRESRGGDHRLATVEWLRTRLRAGQQY